MWRAKHYLLERVVRHYVKNFENVLEEISISALMFGSLRLEEVNFVPETLQDALFDYVMFACEIEQVTAFDVQVSLDWLSVSTKSVQLQARSLEVDLVLRDYGKPDEAQEFWAAQWLRMKAGAEALANPAESTLSYKVLSGLDIVADTVSIRIRTPDDSAPRLLVTLTGMHYGPAKASGSPTTDLDFAIRPNPRLAEISYSYCFEMTSMLFALLPQGGESWADATSLGRPRHSVLEGIGLSLGSHGRAPATGKREAPFYATGVLSAQLRELRTPGPVPLEALCGSVQLLSEAINSDCLRDPEGRSPTPAGSGSDELPVGVEESAAAGGDDSEIEASAQSPNAHSQDALEEQPQFSPSEDAALYLSPAKDFAAMRAHCASETEEDDPASDARRLSMAGEEATRQRFLQREQTMSDMADILKGCRETSREQSSTSGAAAAAAVAAARASERPGLEPEAAKPMAVEEDTPPPEQTPERAATAAPLSSNPGPLINAGVSPEEAVDEGAVESIAASDDFKDCEEFRLLDLPDADHIAGINYSAAVSGEERLRQGVLKRSTFKLNCVNFEVVSPEGSARLELGNFRVSVDSRRSLSSWQVKCFRSLFELEAPEIHASSVAAASADGPMPLESGASIAHADSETSQSSVAGPQPKPAAVATLNGQMPYDNGKPLGITYAGLSLATGLLVFKPPSSPRAQTQSAGSLPGVHSHSRARGAGSCEVFRLRQGLQLRHRGTGDPALLGASGAMQLLEVKVRDLRICDHGREQLMTMGERLAAAVAPSPTPPSASSETVEKKHSVEDKPTPPISCSLEAIDVCVEAPFGSSLWRCSLPAIHLRTVLNTFDDIWSYTLWDPSLIRGMTEPLCSGDPAARPYLEGPPEDEDESSTREVTTAAEPAERPSDLQAFMLDESDTSASLHPVGGGGESVVEEPSSFDGSSLNPSLASEAVVPASSASAVSFRGGEPIGAGVGGDLAAIAVGGGLLGRDLPGKVRSGDVLQRQESPRDNDSGHEDTIGTTSCKTATTSLESSPLVVPSTLGDLSVSTLMFDLDPGKKIWHSVEGLRQGDTLEWAVEELQALNIDVTVIVRSTCKLHAARRLRDTERTGDGPFRDSFSVNDEFGDEQLPLTVDLQLSNGFSWYTEKRVRLTLWRWTREV